MSWKPNGTYSEGSKNRKEIKSSSRWNRNIRSAQQSRRRQTWSSEMISFRSDIVPQGIPFIKPKTAPKKSRGSHEAKDESGNERVGQLKHGLHGHSGQSTILPMQLHNSRIIIVWIIKWRHRWVNVLLTERWKAQDVSFGKQKHSTNFTNKMLKQLWLLSVQDIIFTKNFFFIFYI